MRRSEDLLTEGLTGHSDSVSLCCTMFLLVHLSCHFKSVTNNRNKIVIQAGGRYALKEPGEEAQQRTSVMGEAP